MLAHRNCRDSAARFTRSGGGLAEKNEPVPLLGPRSADCGYSGLPRDQTPERAVNLDACPPTRTCGGIPMRAPYSKSAPIPALRFCPSDGLVDQPNRSATVRRTLDCRSPSELTRRHSRSPSFGRLGKLVRKGLVGQVVAERPDVPVSGCEQAP